MMLRPMSLLVALLLGGCFIFDKKSEAVSFHQLSAPQSAATRPGPEIYVPRAVIPSALRRANIVMLDESGWVRVEDAHRWISPLDRAVAENIAHHLTKLTGLPTAAQTPSGDHLVLLIDIEHMSVTAAKQAVLDLRYRLEKSDGTLLIERSLHQSTPLSDTTPEQYVRAQSANLATAAAQIAQTIPLR